MDYGDRATVGWRTVEFAEPRAIRIGSVWTVEKIVGTGQFLNSIEVDGDDAALMPRLPERDNRGASVIDTRGSGPRRLP